MCTSLTYTDTANQPYFARTMDFPTTTPWRPIFLPRHYAWPTGLDTTRQTRYAILGGGRLPVNFDSCLMADGINEAGLSCAELYLPHAVNYQAQPVAGAINLTPQGFINWVLGEHTDVAAVIADLQRVRIIAANWGDADQVYPFHWLISDQSGASIVVEPTTAVLQAQPNPVGVLTNTPILATHIANLNQFLNVPGSSFSSETAAAARTWIAASRPLPSGPVPTRRFIHMALQRLGQPQLSPATVVPTLLAWLAGVQLPYQPDHEQLSHNYTHYRAVIDLRQRAYTFIARQASAPRTIQLTATMATNWQQPVIYPVV
ncbi:linear amide C-N hydrolase [Lactiplantibacillus plajomi]|uniref:Linear amide C-N hydrolase n=1 Tax=Lactiplantibacillus plajomi TaxID=1457217 RepID=A0ABV6K0H2_9LACO|nr:linear amide C-N hydrolase [Lactiplantibacillus plajomi]